MARTTFVRYDHGRSDLTVFPEVNVGADVARWGHENERIVSFDATIHEQLVLTHPQIPVALTLSLTSPGPGSACGFLII